eukprot:CAMPEP_0184699102 /NCGR_PEP_ID=MMETSP0313-20130426/5486_1 /TAXON_ID=2792 /ORGANISM="Porphyridium aerugineum, Strain SAG 1380-2" /LENGTH=519 /DNA_ID=CAMNT_0027158137 /DNA_START=105 /DNA_END=1664 /DNA_ORIENTATION=+
MDQKASSRVGAGFTLYEVSSRAWLYELRQKYGQDKIKTIADIPDAELELLRDMQIHMLWLQGVWKLGNIGLELDKKEPSRIQAYHNALDHFGEGEEKDEPFSMDDVIGSPYAIVEYVVSEELGGNEAMMEFRKKCLNCGMKLMLDFVPNHMAVDCVWADDPAKKDFFIQKPKDKNVPHNPAEFMADGRAHGKDPYCGAWPDTAQLNYFNPEFRKAQVENLIQVAALCDGMRVDMAMLLINRIHEQTWGNELRASGWKAPPTEFWVDAIKEVRQHYPSTIFMAEVYWGLDSELVGYGFDLAYDKHLYDHLISGHMDNLRGYLTGHSENFYRHSAHFVENHDEPRAVTHFCGAMRANAAAAISFLLPGCRLIFHGQWDACVKRLDVHLRRNSKYKVDEGTKNYYTKLLQIVAQPAFVEPDSVMKFVHPEPYDGNSDNDPWRCVSWSMIYNTNRYFVVVNYTDADSAARFKLPQVDQAETKDGQVSVFEMMSGKEYKRSHEELKSRGLHVVLRPWGIQVFRY